MANSRQKYIRDEATIKLFGENVKRYRQLREYSQEELANKVNIGIAQVKRIEAGKVNTSISAAVLLANALEVNINDLLKTKQ